MRIPKHLEKMIILAMIAVIGIFLSPIENTPKASRTTSSTIDSTIWYPVKRVVDGDTLVVSLGTTTETVRLIGLDTPEVVDPRKPVQCFGKEASAKLKQLLSGQSVRLVSDPTQSTYDKYQRYLAYVYMPASTTPEGILVNELMIREGYGHEYTYDMPYLLQDRFRAAERSARESQTGLWAPGICVK